MSRYRLLAALLGLFTLVSANAADVFVPPVLKGVQGEGKPRRPRPVPFPADDQQWTLVRSRHFIFISSVAEKRTRELAEELETLAEALAKLNPQFKAESPVPTRVILFSRRREAQPYFDLLTDREGANVTGIYVTQKQGGSILMYYGFGRYDRTPFHELVHNLIANSGVTPPLWLDEGLAEYFSNADMERGAIRAGMPVAAHLASLQRRGLIPLEQLFRVERESDTYNLPAGQRTFYAESWAVVDWLFRRAGKDPGKFYDFLHDVETGMPVASALQTRFKSTLAEVQHGIESYGSYGRPTFAVTIPVPNVDTATTTTTLDRADTLYELGSFLSGMESSTAEAERHFRGALEIDPRHAKSIAAIGGLRARDARYPEAERLFEQAVTADPNDASIQLAYAEALLQQQIGPLAEANPIQDEDVPRFRKARELAQRALSLGTTEITRAYGDLGTSYIVEKNADLAPGIAALEKARALAPGRLDYAVHLFSLYRRTGDRAKADPLFTVLEAARNAQVSYASRAVIMRVELARANTLLEQSKLAEAAEVIRGLAAATADIDAKADLERQAAHIAQIADQNQQIEIYNTAINQVNRGEYRAAMKTLNELLSRATDESVIRDAKKLQQKLAARLKS